MSVLPQKYITDGDSQKQHVQDGDNDDDNNNYIDYENLRSTLRRPKYYDSTYRRSSRVAGKRLYGVETTSNSNVYADD
ncbi:hypothetical protein VNO80_23356 [Phaseolus coccineus]|uniref:Uncharacterized protein n=1 Tax=Phaseolus coccineus TaxID=3886 RepID=A0AAN9M6E9_PHACN